MSGSFKTDILAENSLVKEVLYKHNVNPNCKQDRKQLKKEEESNLDSRRGVFFVVGTYEMFSSGENL